MLVYEYDKTDLIYLFAQHGKGNARSKEIIYHAIKTVSDRAERVRKIKDIYGAAAAQSFIKRIICGYSYGAQGVALRYRDKYGTLYEITATWDEVTAQIERAISNGDYFSTDY